MRQMIKQSLLPMLFYVASYAMWCGVFGPGFKGYKLLDFSHFLNPEWLASDLTGSLIYLHSQPPFMNLLIGIIFKIAPEHYEAIFRTLYFLAGASAVIAIDATLRLVAISPRVRTTVLLLLCFTPTFYMFGTWYNSTHLEFCISAWMIFALAHFCLRAEKRRASFAGLCVCFALLGLIRPHWHLGLFIVMILFLARIGGKNMRKHTLLCSLIFIVPIGGWYAKNYYVFGFFGGSSWMGANVAQVASNAAFNDIMHMRADGTIAADYPGDFFMEKIMTRYPPETTGNIHPALGPYKSDDADYTRYVNEHYAPYALYNLNYLGMIPSARQDMRDAITLIRTHPWAYLKVAFVQTYYVTMVPSVYAHSLNMIRADRAVKRLITEPIISFIVIHGSAMLLYLIFPILAVIYAARQPSIPLRQFIYLSFGLMIFMSVTAAALNGYEQERMRWGWQAAYIVFAGILLEKLRLRFRR